MKKDNIGLVLMLYSRRVNEGIKKLDRWEIFGGKMRCGHEFWRSDNSGDEKHDPSTPVSERPQQGRANSLT